MNELRELDNSQNIDNISDNKLKKKTTMTKVEKEKLEKISGLGKMENYYIYIENYGFYSKTDEENSNNLISFSEDNFERRLFELIEADKKKDNLSMIYKYLEDEE